MASPTFWDSQERAQGVVQDLKNLRKVVEPLRDVLGRCEDLGELLAMAEEDPSILDEVQAELAVLEPRIEQLEIRSLLNGANDDCGAILSVHAREGGLDANDWAEMLLGMYTAWAQQHGFSVELLDRSDDETAGITQATIAVRGESAYGYLKGEEGIHRLVPKENDKRALQPSTYPLKLTTRSISKSRRRTFVKMCFELRVQVVST
jgi:peptide chain release factor 2